MLGADTVICQWDDVLEKAACTDHIANSIAYSASAPAKDVINNVKTVSGVKGDNRLEIKFRRLLTTGDTEDYALK